MANLSPVISNFVKELAQFDDQLHCHELLICLNDRFYHKDTPYLLDLLAVFEQSKGFDIDLNRYLVHFGVLDIDERNGKIDGDHMARLLQICEMIQGVHWEIYLTDTNTREIISAQILMYAGQKTADMIHASDQVYIELNPREMKQLPQGTQYEYRYFGTGECFMETLTRERIVDEYSSAISLVRAGFKYYETYLAEYRYVRATRALWREIGRRGTLQIDSKREMIRASEKIRQYADGLEYLAEKLSRQCSDV